VSGSAPRHKPEAMPALWQQRRKALRTESPRKAIVAVVPFSLMSAAYKNEPVSKPAARPADKPDFGVHTFDGAAWDTEGRYSRWLLPTHNGRPALGPGGDFQRILMGQRDRIMPQTGGGGSR
jgi:hypothetical protein